MKALETALSEMDEAAVVNGRNGRGSRRNRDGTRDGRPRDVAMKVLEPRPDVGPQLIVSELETMPEEQLHELAREYEIQGYTRIKRPDLIIRLLQARTEREGTVFGDGILEIIEDGFGFLRGARLLPGPDDIYVSQSQIRRFGLRTGDRVSGQVRPPKDNEKFFSLLRVEAVNGIDPETARKRPSFDTLTPIFPLELIDLETAAEHPLHAPAQSGRADRARAARPDRLAAEGRQDDAAQGDRQWHHRPTTPTST